MLHEKGVTDAALARATSERAFAENRLTAMLGERDALLRRLEAEEAHMANSVAHVQREKVALEVTLEAETEYLVNRLSRQLSAALEARAAAEARASSAAQAAYSAALAALEAEVAAVTVSVDGKAVVAVDTSAAGAGAGDVSDARPSQLVLQSLDRVTTRVASLRAAAAAAATCSGDNADGVPQNNSHPSSVSATAPPTTRGPESIAWSRSAAAISPPPRTASPRPDPMAAPSVGAARPSSRHSPIAATASRGASPVHRLPPRLHAAVTPEGSPKAPLAVAGRDPSFALATSGHGRSQSPLAAAAVINEASSAQASSTVTARSSQVSPSAGSLSIAGADAPLPAAGESTSLSTIRIIGDRERPLPPQQSTTGSNGRAETALPVARATVPISPYRTHGGATMRSDDTLVDLPSSTATKGVAAPLASSSSSAAAAAAAVAEAQHQGAVASGAADADELQRLRQEVGLLRRRLADERTRGAAALNDAMRLAQELEVDAERNFNSMNSIAGAGALPMSAGGRARGLSDSSSDSFASSAAALAAAADARLRVVRLTGPALVGAATDHTFNLAEHTFNMPLSVATGRSSGLRSSRDAVAPPPSDASGVTGAGFLRPVDHSGGSPAPSPLASSPQPDSIPTPRATVRSGAFLFGPQPGATPSSVLYGMTYGVGDGGVVGNPSPASTPRRTASFTSAPGGGRRPSMPVSRDGGGLEALEEAIDAAAIEDARLAASTAAAALGPSRAERWGAPAPALVLRRAGSIASMLPFQDGSPGGRPRAGSGAPSTL